MPPKVSICIPAFNQPEKILNCLESIKIQKYKDFEVIVTDDSNNDSVQKICKQFLSCFTLKYIKNEVTLAVPKNWNKAIRMSNGKYIKFLFHDDQFTDQYSLGKFVNLIETKHVNFAFSGSHKVDQHGIQPFVHSAKPIQINRLRRCPETLFPGNFIGAPSATIFRKKEDLEFDENLRWVVDLDFYYAILSKDNNFNFTTQPLVSVTVDSSTQLTSLCEHNKQLEIYEWFYFYKKIKISHLEHFFFFWKLLNKYNISSTTELAECGINFKLPEVAQHIIFYRQKFRTLLKYRFLQKPLCILCFSYQNIFR